MEAPTGHPDWSRLFETAAAQEGLFTTRQAAEAGYSPQLLVHYVRTGKVIRVYRGIYRLVHFPAGEHEELVAAWLWSELAGVVSHQSALALHGLSDVLPARVHLTQPGAWIRRRFRVPPGVVLHHADVPPEDRSWFGAVPATNPRRTLNDCAKAGLSPELLRQAARQALRRGLVTEEALGDVEAKVATMKKTTKNGREANRGRVLADDACPRCGTTMKEARGRLKLPINEEEITVPSAAHLKCPKCGEIVLRLQEATRLHEDASEIYRRKHGLLSAHEIRAIRERFNLNQADLAGLLRLGANTVSRWESGRNVQTAAMDILLRLIRDLPGSIDYLRDHAA